MKDHDPRSTGLGRRLCEIIGHKLDAAFQKMENKDALSVEVDVEGLSSIHCRKVFFVDLLPWNEQHSDAALQVIC